MSNGDDRKVVTGRGFFSTTPFTLYDFFGYLIPGTIFYLLLYISCYGFRKTGICICISNLIELFKGNGDSGGFTNNYLFLLVAIVLFIIIIYFTGHVIAVISSFFLEKFVFDRIIGYPTKYFFGYSNSKKIIIKDLNGVIYFCIILTAIICIPFLKVIGCNFSHIIEVVGPIYVLIFSTIVVISQISKIVEPYSDDFIKEFESGFKNKFGYWPDDFKDIFWLSIVNVQNEMPESFKKEEHFLNLHAMMRNISMVFLASAIIIFIIGGGKYLVFSGYYLGLCLLFYGQFMKLFKLRHDEIFRAFFVSIKSS